MPCTGSDNRSHQPSVGAQTRVQISPLPTPASADTGVADTLVSTPIPVATPIPAPTDVPTTAPTADPTATPTAALALSPAPAPVPAPTPAYVARRRAVARGGQRGLDSMLAIARR